MTQQSFETSYMSGDQKFPVASSTPRSFALVDLTSDSSPEPSQRQRRWVKYEYRVPNSPDSGFLESIARPKRKRPVDQSIDSDDEAAPPMKKWIIPLPFHPLKETGVEVAQPGNDFIV